MKISAINLLLILNPTLAGLAMMVTNGRPGAILDPLTGLVVAVGLAAVFVVMGQNRVRRALKHREMHPLPANHRGIDPIARDQFRTTTMLSGVLVSSATSSLTAALTAMVALSLGMWLINRRIAATPAAA